MAINGGTSGGDMASNGAIRRRLRSMLPADDIAAMNAPRGPFLEPGETFTPREIPFEQQQEMALAQGLSRGSQQVEMRRSGEILGGLGGFLGPGGTAAFSPRIDATGRPIATPLTFVPGNQFVGFGDDMNDRIREVGSAVKRRLEQLTGAAPAQPQFASPSVRRGRFGF